MLNTPPYTRPDHKKIDAPPMVYIKGEEMTKYTMELIMEQWIKPHINTDKWEFYDLSCKARDESDDKVRSSVCSSVCSSA
jgi:isocitrate dehydrogenase